MLTCKNFRLLKVLTLLGVALLSLATFAQDYSHVYRKPANYIPDDDIILVPTNHADVSFVEKVNNENKKELNHARNKVETWVLTEEYANNHGLQRTGAYVTSTPEQRQRFFERYYLRFYSKEVEKGTNEGLEEMWENWDTDDELDAISKNNEEDGYIVKASGKRSAVGKLARGKKVGVGKKNKKVRFGVQPRIELGSMRLTMDSYWFYASMWVAANGQHELNLTRDFKSTDTSVLANYYILEERLLAAIDQELNDDWSIRLSHERKQNGELIPGIATQDNRLQLRYSIGF